jgi:hypothetical protein
VESLLTLVVTTDLVEQSMVALVLVHHHLAVFQGALTRPPIAPFTHTQRFLFLVMFLFPFRTSKRLLIDYLKSMANSSSWSHTPTQKNKARYKAFSDIDVRFFSFGITLIPMYCCRHTHTHTHTHTPYKNITQNCGALIW